MGSLAGFLESICFAETCSLTLSFPRPEQAGGGREIEFETVPEDTILMHLVLLGRCLGRNSRSHPATTAAQWLMVCYLQTQGLQSSGCSCTCRTCQTKGPKTLLVPRTPDQMQ